MRINLTLEECEKILKLRAEGLGYVTIGKKLNRSNETVRGLINAGHLPGYLTPRLPKGPLQLLSEKYISEIGSTSIKTYKTYGVSTKVVDNYCRQKSLKLADLTREDIVNILNTAKSKNMRFQIFQNIKVLFAWAYRVQYLPSNPMETIKLKTPRTTAKPKIISLPEIKQILEHSKSPIDKLLINLLLYTGLRLHEVLNIKIANINLDNKTIQINRAKMDKIFLKVIPENLVQAIRTYIAIQPIQGQYLILRPDGARYTCDGIQIRLHKLFKAACPNKRITSHMFRHTYASLAAKSIQSTVIGRQALSESMGWSNDKMFNTYIHVGEDQIEIRDMVKKMEETWAVFKEVI